MRKIVRTPKPGHISRPMAKPGSPAIRDGRYLRALTRPFLASYGLDLVEIDKCRSSAEIERRGVCFDRCV